MSCSPYDLRDYLFEELTPAQHADGVTGSNSLASGRTARHRTAGDPHRPADASPRELDPHIDGRRRRPA